MSTPTDTTADWIDGPALVESGAHAILAAAAELAAEDDERTRDARYTLATDAVMAVVPTVARIVETYGATFGTYSTHTVRADASPDGVVLAEITTGHGFRFAVTLDNSRPWATHRIDTGRSSGTAVTLVAHHPATGAAIGTLPPSAGWPDLARLITAAERDTLNPFADDPTPPTDDPALALADALTAYVRAVIDQPTDGGF